MKRAGKVLVFGEDTRSFLAIVRSLGRAGISVHAAPSDFRSPSLRSRFIAARERIPPYVADGAAWQARVEELLRRERYDLVIPCDERALLPLDRYRESFTGLSQLALPDHDALVVLFDKHRTRELAISLGISVAPGRLLQPSESAASLTAEFGLPLVIKPSSSYTLATLHQRGRVRIYDREESLARALATLDDSGHLVEAYRPGRGAGVSILASKGCVLQAFQHVRARERGGASFYRMSAPLSPDLAHSVQQIVAALGFTGLAMFEFKLAENSRNWILLEVNARPWGSMPLPLALGIDFPLRWYRLLVEGEETPNVPYRTGVYQRNLVPDLHQAFALAADRPQTLFARASYLAHTAAEFRRLFTGHEHLDVLVLDDPTPGLCEITRAIAGALPRRWPTVFANKAALRAHDRAIVRRAMHRSRRGSTVIAVLCSGNVCRSPFAAELLRRALFTLPPRIEVLSAGLLPRSGQSSPDAAREAAKDYGIDLGAQCSAFLSEADGERVSIAVIFDQLNREQIRARYPELVNRTVFLGSFLDEPEAPLEIADPDGGDVATFERIYGLTARAISGLAAAIESEGDE